MSAKKITKSWIFFSLVLFPLHIFSAVPPAFSRQPLPLSQSLISVPTDATLISPPVSPTLQEQLGWVVTSDNLCGGYYLEQPFYFPDELHQNVIETVGNQGLFSLRGTSTIEGKVTINRKGQQITTNKALLYRDPNTGKLTAIDLIGNVHLREPNTLIVGKTGHYDFQTNHKSILDIYYRSTLSNKQILRPKVSRAEIQRERKISSLTAWGTANQLTQTEPKIFEMTNATYSTCPPIDPAWHVRASHIVLNKNTGRGYATHARIYVKNFPVFYFPYINFPIDRQRKTGFLWPQFGLSNTWGPYLLTPYYWNMAPNYDMTITPGYLGMRGFQLADNFRYLSTTSTGDVNLTVLPYDHHFQAFQENQENNFGRFIDSPDKNIKHAELERLEDSSTFRRGFFWRDNSQFSPHWSTHLDFNYVSDDYFLRDYGSNLNEVTQNQLLQEGDVYYKSEHWNFTGRLQAYQTLHPINSPNIQNQYRRLPQLILNGSYPDQAFGLEYFITNEVTKFDFLKTPGTITKPINGHCNAQPNLIFPEDCNIAPVGERYHTQPGISLPLFWPAFYMTPRLQFALTQYNLRKTEFTNINSRTTRALPIFDVLSGFSFDRNFTLFNTLYQQTLEPQFYYTYIPYADQSRIPLFDTTINTLTYDQLFNYNRFTGIDRIGDANQLAVGVTSRFINSETGLEKVRIAVGDIVYFADRRVTLCQNPNICTDYPDNPSNQYRLSPVTGTLDYHVNDVWSLSNTTLWNPITNRVDLSALSFRYYPGGNRLINISYSFVANGNPFSGINTNTSKNNLKLTDISFSWPIKGNWEAVGRWSQDWDSNHFQNILYGVQYDTCCWAVRMVGGKSFINMVQDEPQYNNEFYIQFALKGFGDAGTGDPTKFLSGVTGYTSKFGQERL